MANFAAGFNARIRINDTAFAVARWSVRGTAGDLDTTNTEGFPGNPEGGTSIGTASRIRGITEQEITLNQATIDTAANPFDEPIALAEGNYAHIEVFINGLDGPGWDFPSALVVSTDYSGDIRQLQPFSLTARSDGEYTRPGAV